MSGCGQGGVACALLISSGCCQGGVACVTSRSASPTTERMRSFPLLRTALAAYSACVDTHHHTITPSHPHTLTHTVCIYM